MITISARTFLPSASACSKKWITSGREAHHNPHLRAVTSACQDNSGGRKFGDRRQTTLLKVVTDRQIKEAFLRLVHNLHIQEADMPTDWALIGHTQIKKFQIGSQLTVSSSLLTLCAVRFRGEVCDLAGGHQHAVRTLIEPPRSRRILSNDPFKPLLWCCQSMKLACPSPESISTLSKLKRSDVSRTSGNSTPL